MQAFVTGSTGLLGSNLVKLLVEQGNTVKALVRSRAKAERFIAGPGVEIIEGDMGDVTAFAPHLAGCDVLFHTAAYFREYYSAGDHWPMLKRINIDATLELLRAAEQHGLSKVIYTSSSGVLHAEPHQTVDETAPYKPEDVNNLYFKSKVEGEKAIAEFLKHSSLPVVLILPGWMFGPSDIAPTTAGQIVLDIVGGKLPGVLPGGASAVDARDVAQGMINAVERGRSGERYIIGGRLLELTTLAATLSTLAGAKKLNMLPLALVMSIAFISENWARLTNTETVMTVSGVRTMQEMIQFDSGKAERELGVTFRPISETLRDEVAWFRQHGYLPAESVGAGQVAQPAAGD